MNKYQNTSLSPEPINRQLKTVASESNRKMNKMPALSPFRRQHTEAQSSPGPGAYYIETQFNKKKGVTIICRTKPLNDKQQKPNPWTYIPNNKVTMPKSPNATFGRQKKIERFKNAPGPADYKVNYKAMLQRSRMPVMGNSRKLQQIEQKPGPSDYDTLKSDKVLKRTISHHIGTSQRSKTALQNYPGPSQYKIDDQFTMKAKNKRGYTMGSKGRSKTVLDGGNNFLKYNVDKLASMKKAPCYSITKNKRQPLSISCSPGPAAYSPNNRAKQGITIPKSHRSNDKLNESNTASFSNPPVDKGPSYTIPKSNSNEKKYVSPSPGPADYSPKQAKQQKFKEISIGSSDRTTYDLNKNPGPSDYTIKTEINSRGFTIGHSKRSHERQQSRSPGPGQYKINMETLNKFVSLRKK